jgi:hypothetical protein
MDTTLDHAGKTIENPTDADLDGILSEPRDDDWFLSLYRGGDDFMEVMIDAGELWVETEVAGRFTQARSRIDEPTVKAMLVSFRDGTENWRDLALWKEPEPAKKDTLKGPAGLILGLALTLVSIGIVGMVTGKGGWIVVAFALALPGIIAVAALVKIREVKRAASWKKASGRVVRSELVAETRQGKEVQVPRIEYEYSVGFHKFVGKRVNFAEVIAGAQAKEARARYPVGTAVQVHYNPAKPDESVIERELPPFVHAIWGVVAVMTAAILFGAWWYLVR